MKVKICGITHPDDAEYAAQKGADYIGLIFAERSKRCITLSQAMEISQAARQNGAIPVGVFVDHAFEEIVSICSAAEIKTVQLHGGKSQGYLEQLHGQYSLIYSIQVGHDGLGQIPELPHNVHPLFESSHGGGTGKTFDWAVFSPPVNRQWFLAGGLNVVNVSKAIRLLRPYAVDVASGTEMLCSTRKDPGLVEAFIDIAKGTGLTIHNMEKS